MPNPHLVSLVSRLDFLKLAGTAGAAFMLLPLVPFGKALGANATATSKPLVVKRVNRVGADGVVFYILLSQGVLFGT